MKKLNTLLFFIISQCVLVEPCEALNARRLSGVGFICLIPFWWFAIFAFYRQRNVHPIKGRLPRTVITQALTCSLFCLFLALEDTMQIETQCLIGFSFSYFFDILIGCLYLFRCWNLYFRAMVTKEKLELFGPAVLPKSKRTFPRGSSVESKMDNADPQINNDFEEKQGLNVSSEETQPLNEDEGTKKKRVLSLSSSQSKSSITRKHTNSNSSFFRKSAHNFEDNLRAYRELSVQKHDNQLKTRSGEALSVGSENLVDQRKIEQADKDLWFLHNLKSTWLNPTASNRAIILIFFLLMIPALLLIKFDDSLDPSNTQCKSGVRHQIVNGIMIMFCIVFGYFALKFRSIVDGYYILEELRITAVSALTGIIGLSICYSVAPMTGDQQDFREPTFVIQLILLSLSSICIIFPLYLSYYRSPVIDEVGIISEDEKKLKNLLQSYAGMKSFEDFLSREFNVENLIFWKFVQIYSDDFDINSFKENLKFAKYIYKDFIVEGSDFQVNLSSRVQEKLKKDLDYFTVCISSGELKLEDNDEDSNHKTGNSKWEKHMDDNGIPYYFNKETKERVWEKPIDFAGSEVHDLKQLFNVAEKEIFSLMEHDPFPRYLASDCFKDYLSGIKKEAVQLQRIALDEIIESPSTTTRNRKLTE